MSNKNTYSAGITDKIRSSLVLKLNMQMLGRMFGGFLAVNILLLLVSLSFVLWRAEEGAQAIIADIKLNPANLQAANYMNRSYQVSIQSSPPQGVVFPSSLQKRLPLKAEDVKRGISIPWARKETGFLERVSLVKYDIGLTINSRSYKIVYDLGTDLRLLLSLIFIVLIWELIILISNAGKGSKAIKKTLKPLSEMAEKAKQLNDEVFNMRSMADGTPIKDLAGAISDIDASRLDRRISVDGSQNEMRR